MIPAFDRVHREAGLESIRYPGGTVASTFEWKHAIGPVKKRRKIQPAQGLKPGGGGPQVATWGVDEAARWCEQNKVELVYMYGIGAPNSNPQDAADLVEYLNAPVGQNKNGGTDWAKMRANNGHPAPYNIRFFEIANEGDGPNSVQRYWFNAVDTDENRAKRTLPMQPQRQAYAPEYCFGGVIRYDRQPVTLGDDLRDSAGISSGAPNLRRVIRYYPVLPESVEVFVGDRKWEAVPDITQAKGQVYQLNAATGEVRFGDGMHGDIPAKGAMIAATYRARRAGFVDYYPAMKAVDSRVRIFAGFESPNIIRTLGDKHLYDGIVVHPYTNEYNVPKARTMNEWHENLMLSGARLGREIQEYQDLIDTTVSPARRGQVKVICTEYGPNRQEQVLPPSDGATRAPTYRLLSSGLYDATQLMHWMRVGMPHAQRHATTVGVFGPPPLFEPSPTALAFQLFTRHFGDQRIGFDLKNNPQRPTDKVEVSSRYTGSIRRNDAPNLPADAKPLLLPRLECEASRDAQGNLYLMVLNQDATDDLTASIEIAGVPSRGTAEVWMLNGPSATAFNTPQAPNAVKITTAKLTSGAGPLRHTGPAHSLTAITFSAKP
jgi:alpha-N-arabinofuranosidase